MSTTKNNNPKNTNNTQKQGATSAPPPINPKHAPAPAASASGQPSQPPPHDQQESSRTYADAARPIAQAVLTDDLVSAFSAPTGVTQLRIQTRVLVSDEARQLLSANPDEYIGPAFTAAIVALLHSTSGGEEAALRAVGIESIYWSPTSNYATATLCAPESIAHNILGRCDRHNVLELNTWGRAHVSTGDSNAKTWAVRLVNVPQQFQEHHLRSALNLHGLHLIRASRELEPRSGFPRMKCWDATLHCAQRPPQQLTFYLPNASTECFHIGVHCKHTTMPTVLLDVDPNGTLKLLPHPLVPRPARRSPPAPTAPPHPGAPPPPTADTSTPVNQSPGEGPPMGNANEDPPAPEDESSKQGDANEEPPAQEGDSSQQGGGISQQDGGIELPSAPEGNSPQQGDANEEPPAPEGDSSQQGGDIELPPAPGGDSSKSASVEPASGDDPPLSTADQQASLEAAAHVDQAAKEKDADAEHAADDDPPTCRQLNFGTPPKPKAGDTRKTISSPVGAPEPSPPRKRLDDKPTPTKDQAPPPEAARRSTRLQEKNAREG